MPIVPLPITYRTDLMRAIYLHLDAGKCGALYGIASSGKSRLVEFMGRPDVRRRYSGEDWPRTLLPWVDGNDLLEHTEWGLCEKILSAILADMAQLPERGGAARAKAAEWYWQLIRSENKALARRYLAFAIEDLVDYRIVLLLDEMEEFMAGADDLVFAGLRGLRDRFKRDNQYRVLYLLTSRRKLVHVHPGDSLAFASFRELFKDFTQPLGCYRHDDAAEMLKRLSGVYSLQRVLTSDLVEQLIEVTGGHAGLIDAAYHSGTEADWGRANLASALIGADSVFNECVSIDESLDEADMQAVEAISAGQDPGPVQTRTLEATGLVRRDARQAPQVIELLKLYVHRYTAERDLTMTLRPDRCTVIINGASVLLDAPEFAAVQRLHQAGGQLCSYQELFLCMYPGDTYRDRLLPAIQRLVEATDRKLQRGSGRRFIKHELGRGYRLIGVSHG